MYVNLCAGNQKQRARVWVRTSTQTTNIDFYFVCDCVQVHALSAYERADLRDHWDALVLFPNKWEKPDRTRKILQNFDFSKPSACALITNTARSI